MNTKKIKEAIYYIIIAGALAYSSHALLTDAYERQKNAVKKAQNAYNLKCTYERQTPTR